jgi:hypothetical protein
MGLFDWNKEATDDDEPTTTLIGYATPEFEDNLRAGLGRPLAWDDSGPSGCIRCGEPKADHCRDCGACYDHAGWCPSDPDNIAHADKE